MAEELLDFPQILSHLVEQDRGSTVPEPVRCRLKARFENGSPEYPANTNCEAAKAIQPGARMRRALKPSWGQREGRCDKGQ
jgi:hypothetical protein